MNNEAMHTEKNEAALEDKAESAAKFMESLDGGVQVLERYATESEDALNRFERFVDDAGYDSAFARGLSESDEFRQISRLKNVLQGEFSGLGKKLREAREAGDQLNVEHARHDFSDTIDALGNVTHQLYGEVANVYGILERARGHFDSDREETEAIIQMKQLTRELGEEVEGMGKFLKSFGSDLVR